MEVKLACQNQSGINPDMISSRDKVIGTSPIGPPCYHTDPWARYRSVLVAQKIAQTTVLAHRRILWRGPIQIDVLDGMAQGHVPATPALCNSCLYFHLIVARSACVAKRSQHSIEPSNVTT